MLNKDSNPLYAHGINPWILLLSLIGISLGGVLLIGNVLAFVTALVMSGVGIDDLLEILRKIPLTSSHGDLSWNILR